MPNKIKLLQEMQIYTTIFKLSFIVDKCLIKLLLSNTATLCGMSIIKFTINIRNKLLSI